MATGTWSETQKPTIPGMYNRFKWIAEQRLIQSTVGVLGMLVKADWGPVKQVISVADLTELKNKFGSNMDLTAYKLGRLALLGGPKELLLYRLVDGLEKAASITLKDTATTAVDVITLETLYPTTRKFNISIKPDIIDDSVTDIILYEDTEQLYVFKVSGTIDNIVNKINNDGDNLWIKASKKEDSTNKLASIVSQPFEGGNNGTDGITNQHYIDAMTTFEGYKLDGFTLDGISDSALQATLQAWIDKNKPNGADVLAFVGADKDATVDTINAQSKAFNDEAITNVGTSGIYEGIEYSPAEVACYIAGLAVSKTIKESICNAKTIFEDVNPKLTRNQIIECEASGTLVLVNEQQSVIVVDDVNTLKNFADGQSEALGYIRAVKFMYTANYDTTALRSDFVGKLTNEDLDQKVIISGFKKYFETLQSNGVIKDDFTVEIDTDMQTNAKDDEFYWKWSATYINVIKKIFGTGYVQ